MNKQFELTFYVVPNSQVEVNINDNSWLPVDLFQYGKVISKSNVEFSNVQYKGETSLVLNSSEKPDLIKNFFAICSSYSDKSATTTPMSDFFNANRGDYKELEYINNHFNKLIAGYNYPSMSGFLNYINKNGFSPDAGINIPELGYGLGLPGRTRTGRLAENEIKEIGNLALLVNWNFLFQNELVNIPQQYDSRISILKNHQYDNHLFSMCVPSLTPLDRVPVLEAYEKLKK